MHAEGEIAQQISAVFVLVSFWASPSSSSASGKHLFPLQEKTTFDLGHFLGCSIFQTLHILISCSDTSDHQSRVCQVLQTLLVSQVCVSTPKSKLRGENKLIFKKTLSCTGHMHEGQREERSTGCRWSSSWVLPGIQEWRQAGELPPELQLRTKDIQKRLVLHCLSILMSHTHECANCGCHASWQTWMCCLCHECVTR